MTRAGHIPATVLALSCPTVEDVREGRVTITSRDVALLRRDADGGWTRLGPFLTADIDWKRLPPTLRVYVPET